MNDDTGAITEAHIIDLYNRPGTVLVLTADEPAGYTAHVVAEDETAADAVRVYRYDHTEPDERGLSRKVRAYVTHAAIRADVGPAGPAPDDPDWADRLAYCLLPHAAACWAVHERGDDALLDELADDPTAWSRYTT